MCCALVARFRRRAMMNIDPGDSRSGSARGKSTSLRIPYTSHEGLTKMSAPACARSLAILSFHKIGAPSDHEWNTWSYIPEKVFIDQLEWLRKNDWDVIGIHDFLRGLSDPGSLHERSVLLTFDDGYQSMATIALPCLQRFGYPAVVFVPT